MRGTTETRTSLAGTRPGRGRDEADLLFELHALIDTTASEGMQGCEADGGGRKKDAECMGKLMARWRLSSIVEALKACKVVIGNPRIGLI